MDKIAINALIIDEKRTGIGQYAYNIIKNIININKDLHIDIYIQPCMRNKFDKTEHTEFIECKNFKKSIFRILYEQLALPIKLKKNDYRLVYFMDYNVPLVMKKTDYILSVYDLSYLVFPKTFTFLSRKIKQLIAPIAILNAKHILTISEFSKKEILRFFRNINNDNISIHYPAIATINNNQVEDSNYLQKDYILYVGTIEPRKNIKALIEALYLLWSKENVNTKLVIIGKKGWLFKEVFDLVEKLNVNNSVIFKDYVTPEEINSYYKNAKLFVYPSIYEGFGMPVIEAMSYGIPVITSNCSSLPEAAGKAAILVNPNDVNQLAMEIQNLLNNENKRLELIKLGYNQVNNFNWEKTTTGILKVIKEQL